MIIRIGIPSLAYNPNNFEVALSLRSIGDTNKLGLSKNIDNNNPIVNKDELIVVKIKTINVKIMNIIIKIINLFITLNLRGLIIFTKLKVVKTNVYLKPSRNN